MSDQITAALRVGEIRKASPVGKVSQDHMSPLKRHRIDRTMRHESA